MRVGLIGNGAWGQHHASALAQAPCADLAAIATRDWRKLLNDGSIEAVFIAVPNALHAEIALAALAAGKHVLLEKPMALTIADCDRLVEAAKTSGRVLTIGHELRLSQQWGRSRALIEEGAIGPLCHAAVSLFRFPYRTGSGGWRYDKAAVGSWILEEPVHFFDLLLWYGREWGPPLTVRALAEGEPSMPRALAVTLRFAGGRFAALNTVVAGFEHHLALHAVGQSGAIRATWSASMDRSTAPVATLHVLQGRAAPGEPGQSVPFTQSGEVFELALQAEQAIQGFRQGRALVPPEQARDAVRCCLLAERSAGEGGREIGWNETLP